MVHPPVLLPNHGDAAHHKAFVGIIKDQQGKLSPLSICKGVNQASTSCLCLAPVRGTNRGRKWMGDVQRASTEMIPLASLFSGAISSFLDWQCVLLVCLEVRNGKCFVANQSAPNLPL